jgi:broad specificity phosphatase PhoE
MRLLAILAALLLAVPAGAGTIYVTRHYDTPAGERDPDLTATGQARAAALAKRFATRKLSAVYVTQYKRTQQTVAPLVARQGLTPVVYGPAPSPDFFAQLKAAKGDVLVVGHSNTVPDIVAGLGGTRPAPIPHEDFGGLWAVKHGKTKVERIAP